MSLITDFIYKIYNRLLGKEEPVEQNDDIAVIPSTSVKRWIHYGISYRLLLKAFRIFQFTIASRSLL